jgi:hypothetical protein
VAPATMATFPASAVISLPPVGLKMRMPGEVPC